MVEILSLIIPALLPPVADGFKRITSKWFGRSVEEEIKLMQAETEKLKALAELDKPSDNISVWVANLRASFRYIAIGLVLIVTCILGIIGFITTPDLRPAIMENFLKVASSCLFFMIGDRVYLHISAKK